MKYLAAIDVGTTGSKAIIIDLKGQVLGKGYQEYPVLYPEPLWVEQRASELLDGAFFACRQAVKASGVDGKDIVSVSFSAQRATFGLLNAQNEVIHDRLYVWQDNRADEIMPVIKGRIDPYELYKIQGQPITPTFALEKLVWLKHHQPEMLQQAETFALVVDLVAYAFGAELVTERADAGCSSMLDLHTGAWSSRILDAYDIPKKLFTKVVSAGEVIGHVSPEASVLSGLAAGTLIVAGSGDNQCGALGAGVVKAGQASMSLGTSGVLVVGNKEPLLNEDMGLMVAHALAPDLYELEAIQLGAASSYRWLRDTLCLEEVKEGVIAKSDPFVLMEKSVVKSPVGSNGLIFSPYLMGSGYPHWNVQAEGSFVGITFSTTREDMIRSVMEGITFESKDMYETLKARGITIDIITIIGGATKSPTWCQILADMFDTPVRRLKNEDATLVGAAILAGVGAGVFSTMQEGVDALVAYDVTLKPMKEHVRTYNTMYAQFQKIYQGLNGNP